MSWSLSAIGKPAAVATKLATEFATGNYNEPEATVRKAVASAIAAALKAYPAASAVKVEAAGSQNGSGPTEVINSLSVKVESVYGFIE